MLNQIVLVGRLSDIPKKEDIKEGEEYCNIKLAVTSAYKNKDGIYETDIVNCKVGENMYENIVNYCKTEKQIIDVKEELDKPFTQYDRIRELQKKARIDSELDLDKQENVRSMEEGTENEFER